MSTTITNDEAKKLLEYLYGVSDMLGRIEDERGAIKDLTEITVDKFGGKFSKKVLNRAARVYHKDVRKELSEEIQEVFNIIDTAVVTV